MPTEDHQLRLQNQNSGEEEPIEATVQRSVFSNEENGWAVLRCKNERGEGFLAVGTLLGVVKGDRLRLTGRWVDHSKFGTQFQVVRWVHISPTTDPGIRTFLGSGRVRGIGSKMAGRIVDAFGLESLDVIENDPDRLREVRGIGATTVRRIKDSWAKHAGIQQLMVFLTGHGVSPNVAAKAHSRYGAKALDVVRANPYRLAGEVFGVGFRTADGIAQNLGMATDATERLEAGLLYALGEAAGNGHCFLPRNQLVSASAELLEVPEDTLNDPLERLVKSKRASQLPGPLEEPAIYPRRLEVAEASVARSIKKLLVDSRNDPGFDVRQAVGWFQARSKIHLADRQLEALAAALVEPVTVITGGPGTGKTTLIRGVIEILRAKKRKVLLAAPTGRAAKRLHEATNEGARTIHRLLEFNPSTMTFARSADNPLDADVVVLDEVSMLDVELARYLLDAIPTGCRLVLVGDADQLPSVGPGNVLADLINSGRVHVNRLTDIFRQAEQSLIVVNAHRINHGEMPFLKQGEELQDFYFVEREDPSEAAELAIDLVTRRIPHRFGFDPIDHIQILAPMHRGELGVANLNDRLQSILVPGGPEVTVGSRRFRVGDKVMQIRNNYDLDIFNGDIGRIESIDVEEREIIARFDGNPVIIPSKNLDDLVPAYACTIHKSQGSEYPAVVVLLHQQHWVMLQRNLLYTAVTRGKRLVVIVGTRKALGRAVRNSTVRRRNTMLAKRLRDNLE